MLHKLSILFTLALMGCSQSSRLPEQATQPVASVVSDSLPAGFSVIEKHPAGYFIRLASAERVNSSTIRELASTFAGKFDCVDLCLDVAHERGDEYASIIDGKVFDYENDNIYSLNSPSK